MIEQIIIYIILFGIIIFIGQLFNKSPYPISLILVIVGILLSFIPHFPIVNLNSDVVLNIFLPLMIYQISAFSSWKETKKNLRPIILLSVGHVIFITFIVAIVIHALIPALGWPLSIVLGSVISPPDDVAIIAIAEKIRMPERIITILEGEAISNDATALILFRLALVAVFSNQFSLPYAIDYFLMVVIGETLYGFLIGHIIGTLRLRITNQHLHIIASLLTPFIAYIPVEMLGGSGILATVIAGLVIGTQYAVKFTPEFRLFSRSLWPAIFFALVNVLFLLVGLNMGFIYKSISSIAWTSLLIYSSAIIATIIIGRFIWVYAGLIYLPRAIFPSIRKKDPTPPWQYPFIISWAGMRGPVSLAAILAVPTLPMIIDGVNPKNLLIFFVIAVITFTLIFQGFTLPWILKIIGIQAYGQKEKYNEHLSELTAKIKLSQAVLRWLDEYKEEIKDDTRLLKLVRLYTLEYRMMKSHLEESLENHQDYLFHDDKVDYINEIFILSQIIAIEREEVLKLWVEEKINLTVRNKLLDQLDHRVQYLS